MIKLNVKDYANVQLVEFILENGKVYHTHTLDVDQSVTEYIHYIKLLFNNLSIPINEVTYVL